ncbi:MAG: hypothetical protein RLZ95_728 [Bacteroidota bacterium]|jgi:uncharacterized protein (TIGR00730 family)
MKIHAVTVFCGSKSGNDIAYEQAASDLGTMLAQEGICLVYGGGNKGIMGAVANASLVAGGKVIGIIPKLLLEWEAQHEELTELIVTDSMHSRKLLLYDKCDVAVILPGGMGTMDELFEMLTWNNLKIHNKKVFIININGYYDAMIQLLDTMDAQGFMYESWRNRLIECNSIKSFKDALALATE